MSRTRIDTGVEISHDRAGDVHYYATVPSKFGSRSNVSMEACCLAHARVWRTAALKANQDRLPHPSASEHMRCWTGTAPQHARSKRQKKSRSLTVHQVLDGYMSARRRRAASHRKAGRADIDRLDSGIDGEERECRRLKRYFAAHVLVEDVDPDFVAEDLPTWLALEGAMTRDRHGRGLNSTSAALTITFGRRVFKWARNKGLTQLDPFLGAEAFRTRDYDGPKERLRALSDLLAVVRELPRQWRCLGFLMLVLGLRVSEALGVRLCDVDLGRRMIHMCGQGGRQLVTTLPSGERVTVDWRAGTKATRNPDDPVGRVVVIPRCLEPVIRWQIRHFHSDLGDEWPTSDRTLVYAPGPSGRTTYDVFRRQWTKALERLGLRERRTARRGTLTPHSLRKNCGTRLLLAARHVAASLDAASVSDWLGHTPPTNDPRDAREVTIDAYFLDQPWDERDPYALGLLSVSQSIDAIFEDCAPAGLLCPDGFDDHLDWIGSEEAAVILGVTSATALRLFAEELAPFVLRESHGRRAFRVPRTAVLAYRCESINHVTPAVAAARLGVTVPTLYQYIRSGVIEAERPTEGRWLMTVESVDALLAERRKRLRANNSSVTFQEAAWRLSCRKIDVECLVAAGLLGTLGGAADRTVSRASLDAYVVQGSTPFAVTAEYAMSALVVSAGEFAKLIAQDQLDVTMDGMITRASIEPLLVSRRKSVPRATRKPA